MPERTTSTDAVPDRQPGSHRRGRRARGRAGPPADRELLRRSAGEGSTAAIEFHGDDALARARQLPGVRRDGRGRAVRRRLRAGPARPARRSRARPGRAASPRWPRAIDEGRPHRASGEQAAHVVDILEAAAASMAAGWSRRRGRLDVHAASSPCRGPWFRRPVDERPRRVRNDQRRLARRPRSGGLP